MATAPRQASLSSVPSNRNHPSVPSPEQATIEESPHDLELLTILREAAASKPLESIADAVADAARVLSSADGTALGLESKGAILCRACSGRIAPPLGAPISTKSGISGECLRTGAMLVCHDAMIDPRVDAEVCRSLGIRSVAAVPVRGPMGVAGILEAFSARPNAFDGDALNSLRELAEIAEMAYVRETRDLRPAVRPAAAAPRLSPYVQSAPVRPAAHVQPALAADDILEGMSEPGKRRLWIVGAVALALMAIAVAWWNWRTPADEVSSTSPTARVATPEPAPSAPPLQFTPKPAPGVLHNRLDRGRPQIVSNAADVKLIEVRPDPAPMEISSASLNAPAAMPKTRKDSDLPVVEPPSVQLSSSLNTDDVGRLASAPMQMPTAGPRVSEGVVEPSLVRKIAPTYPTQARNDRISGTVVLSATIGADGLVRDITVIKGSPVLAEAAKTAVRKWKYDAAKLNGNPIAVQKQITFVFTLP